MSGPEDSFVGLQTTRVYSMQAAYGFRKSQGRIRKAQIRVLCMLGRLTGFCTFNLAAIRVATGERGLRAGLHNDRDKPKPYSPNYPHNIP